MKVYIVPSFHHDVAYLKSWPQYLSDSLKIIEKALDILSNEPDYRFTIEQVILLQEYWDRNPCRHKDIVEFVQKGRLGILPGSYVTPDTNIPCGESLFMQITIAKKWLRDKLNYEPKVWWLVDSFGHHGQMQQILKSCGYDYYVFSRGMSPEFMRNAFLWQGIDGTEMKVFWLSQGYGNILFPEPVEVENIIDLNLGSCSHEHISKFISETQRYGLHESVLLCNCGDMMFPQQNGCMVVQQLNSTSQGKYSIEIALPSKFLKEIDWRVQPRYENEFNSLFQGIYGSNIGIKLRSHKLFNRLLALEKLSVLTLQNYEFANIWKLLLKQQAHDIIAGTICNDAVLDANNELADAENLINGAFKKVAGNYTEEYFFNPSNYGRQEIVEHNGCYMLINAGGFECVPLKICEICTELPVPQLPLTFENEFYKVYINVDGYIDKMLEKKMGNLIYEKNDLPFAHLNLQIDNGDLWLNFNGPLAGGSAESMQTHNIPDPYSRSSLDPVVCSATFVAKIDNACIRSFSDNHFIVEQTGTLQFWRLKIGFTTLIKFSKNSPRIDFKTTLKTSGRNYRVRVAFPTDIIDGIQRHEIPFGIQQRGVGQHPAQSWVDLSNEYKGLTVFNRGIPGHSIDNNIILMTLLRSTSMEYKAQSDIAYLEGMQHIFDYAIMPHGTNAETAMIENAINFTNPIIPITAKPDFLKWSIASYPGNICITSLRWSDGDIFIRLYDAIGKQTDAKIIVKNFKGKIFETDGIENIVSKGINISNVYEFTLKPFEIKSFKVSCD